MNKFIDGSYLISLLKFSTLAQFEPVCSRDFISHAENIIRPDLFSYYQSGATNEVTLSLNERAFSRIFFIPKMLRDVRNRDFTSKLLELKVRHPFGLAPTASHKLAHSDGETASAMAAAATGTPMIVSTLSSVALEDVAKAYIEHYDKSCSHVPLWFQLYIFKDRALTQSLIERAEASGYSAIVVTIDTPISGIRYENLRARLSFPDDINYANLVGHLSLNKQPKENFFAQVANSFDDSLTWTSMLEYLRSVTKLPIVVKGVLSVNDALLAVQHGVQGIIVSNHGARQLDTVPPTIECLAKIAKHVPSSVGLYMDGGIRSGDDILKAIALGANAVFIGRPVLWALAYGGSEGVIKLIEILRRELDVSMALNGVSDLKDVPRDIVVRASDYFC